MNNRKYPFSLFVMGFVTNVLFRYGWLFLLAIILLIIGIFAKICFYIGLAILLLDIILSLIEQIKLRKTFLAESSNPDFQAFQEALSKDGDWKDNFKEFLNQKIPKTQNETQSNGEKEDQ